MVVLGLRVFASVVDSFKQKLVLTRCLSGIDLTSSKHCQLCDSSKTKRMQLINKDGRKAILHLGGSGIPTKTHPTPIDPGKPDRK